MAPCGLPCRPIDNILVFPSTVVCGSRIYRFQLPRALHMAVYMMTVPAPYDRNSMICMARWCWGIQTDFSLSYPVKFPQGPHQSGRVNHQGVEKIWLALSGRCISKKRTTGWRPNRSTRLPLHLKLRWRPGSRSMKLCSNAMANSDIRLVRGGASSRCRQNVDSVSGLAYSLVRVVGSGHCSKSGKPQPRPRGPRRTRGSTWPRPSPEFPLRM